VAVPFLQDLESEADRSTLNEESGRLQLKANQRLDFLSYIKHLASVWAVGLT